MNIFAIGDMHGAHKALVQCLKRSKFDYEQDRLIVLGDVCDRYPEVRQCIDELLKIEHCDLILGNHDVWTLDWALQGLRPEIWTSQGGDNTIRSYDGGPMPKAHVDFLQKGHFWLEFRRQIFVHGGFNPNIPISNQSSQSLVWDRELLDLAWQLEKQGKSQKFGHYDDIFVGHTPTQFYNSLTPIHACNVWALDTGAGGSGNLTIMNVETKEYWQSDLTTKLYGMSSYA